MDYKSPLELLLQWEREMPDKVYLRQPINNVWHTWTWKETAAEARKMAAAIAAMKFPPGSNIGLVSKNCAHWIICDLAIMMSGHTSVPLYPNLTADSMKQILVHSDAVLLFVGKLDNWQNMKKGVPEGLTCISFPFCNHKGYTTWNEIMVTFEPVNKVNLRGKDEIATILYTSGTTGISKGVVHQFSSLSFTTLNAIPYLEFDSATRFFSYLPLSHSAERSLVEMCSIYTGAEVFFSESIEKFAFNLCEAKPTVFLGVPQIWNKIQQRITNRISQKKLDWLLRIPFLSELIKRKIRKSLGLSEAVHIFTGAAPTSVELLQWFKKIGINIQEGYGLTENWTYSHITKRDNIKIGYAGQPFPGVEVKLGENNEILIRHNGLMRGYYKEPEKTREAFTWDGFLKTGDTGTIEGENFLKITGRIKDIFKTSKGNYVAPSHIEMKISGNSIVNMACVIGSGMPQPLALVTLSDTGKKLSKSELELQLGKIQNQLNSRLDVHEKISGIIVSKDEWTTDNGLLTATFKVKRNEIEKKYAPI